MKQSFAAFFFLPLILIAQTNELIISEYIEGSSYNKALEIFNGTGVVVDLSQYSIQKDQDGDNDFDRIFLLNGILANESVYIIAHSSADSLLIRSLADTITGSVTNFNGNDQIRLVKDTVEVDRIGIAGGINFGNNVTYVRDSSVTVPRSGEQDPRSNGEWIAYESDYFGDLGFHILSDKVSNLDNKKYVQIEEFELLNAYPNPFNPVVFLSFNLHSLSGFIELSIYNILGQKIVTLYNGKLNYGLHTMIWDASQQASGSYVALLTNGKIQNRTKLLLIK